MFYRSQPRRKENEIQILVRAGDHLSEFGSDRGMLMLILFH